MPCTQIPALPSGSSVLTGDELFPGADASGVTRKYGPGAIANYGVGYDSSIPYPEGAVVHAADDNLYYALQTVPTNNFPELSPLYWKFLVIQNNVTLNVPADYATIIVALAAINQATITDEVTIQVADGAYNYTTTQIDLSHPYGDKISILGNTGTPASCSLSFAALPNPPSSPYITDDSGSLFAAGESNIFIDGFALAKSGGAAAFGHCGLLASNGATIRLGANVTFTGFWANVAALNGGNIIGDVTGGNALATTAGTAAVYADNGHVQLAAPAITGLGRGVWALREGTVRLDAATLDTAIDTAFILDNGHLEAFATVAAQVNIVYLISGASSAKDTGSTIAAPATAFIRVDGQLVYNDTTLVGNAADIASGDIATGTIQHAGAGGESVFLTDTGIDTLATPLILGADGNTGVTISNVTGAAAIPVSLALGATAATTGLQGGSGVFDAGGLLTVPATWVTANTILTATFRGATGTGLLHADSASITPGVSFVISSSVGAADAGVSVGWQAIVYL